MKPQNLESSPAPVPSRRWNGSRYSRLCLLVLLVGLLGLMGGCGDNSDDDSDDMLADVADQTGDLDEGDVTADADASVDQDTQSDMPGDIDDTGVGDMSIDFGPPGDASCEDILGCLLGCDADDERCQNMCIGSGTELARDEIQAYLGCVDRECPDAVTPTELTTCVNENCSAEQAACLRI